MRMPFPILSIAATIPSLRRSGQSRTSCGNAIYTLCVRSAQLVLHHLAGGVQRQPVEELYIPGHLETRHALAAPRDELVSAHRGSAVLRDDERLTDLTHSLIRHADHRGLGDGGMLQQEPLDLGGVGVEAADDEHVLLTPDDAQPSRRIERAQVADV